MCVSSGNALRVRLSVQDLRSGSCHGFFFLANLRPVPPPCSFDPDLISTHVFTGEGRP